MLRNGRFPRTVHTLLEYAAGVLLVVAPFVLAFADGTATAVSIVLGVLVLALAATTDWPLALMRSVPVPTHLVLDFVLAAVLVASPFIFGFSTDTPPTAFFIALGVVHLLLTLGTRFLRDDEPATARDRARVTPAEPAAEPARDRLPPPETPAPPG